MAADYLRAVREQQPQGPYQFLGFSFGGVLAYEMAQQLVAQGEQVSLMALLDSVLPSAQARNWARSAVRRLKRGGSRALVLLPDGLRRNLQSTTESMDPVRLEKTRYRIYIDAMDRYRPRPYDGPSLLLRCEATLAQDDLIDPSYGWGRYVDRLEIRDVHGDHATVLSRPNVRVLADTLRPRLA